MSRQTTSQMNDRFRRDWKWLIGKVWNDDDHICVCDPCIKCTKAPMMWLVMSVHCVFLSLCLISEITLGIQMKSGGLCLEPGVKFVHEIKFLLETI
jgi:hypothetical protein